MRKIYIDSDSKCHLTDDGSMSAVETSFFDGKCDTFVEGYCYKVKDTGISIYPWKSYSELDAAQREYERMKLADAENALAILLGGESV